MKAVGLISVAWVAAVVGLAGCGSAGVGTGASPAGKLELAAAAGGHAAMAAAAPEVMPMRPTRYVLDATLPSLGAKAAVWRLAPHPLSLSDVRHFAAALALTAAPTRTPTGWQVLGTDASLSFVVSGATEEVSYGPGGSASGGASTSSGSGGVVDQVGTAVPPGLPGASGAVGGASAGPIAPVPSASLAAPPTTIAPPPATLPAPVDVPSAGQAQSSARSLLDRLGVLAGQQWSAEVSDSAGIAVACSSGQACPADLGPVFARTVTFSPVVDGVNVGGVGWSVTLGEHGRVESLDGDWATPVPAGSYPLLTTDAAFGGLQRGDARYAGPQPMIGYAEPAGVVPGSTGSAETLSPAPVVVRITGVSLGLARWDAYLHGSPAVELVPTYRFHATDGSSSYDIEVLALSPDSVTFTTAAIPPGTPQPEPLPPASSSSAVATPGSAAPPS